MENRLYTFWGRLRRDNSLTTSEGTLHNVLIPTDVNVLYVMSGFFLVEKRGRNWIVKKYLSETLINKIVSGSGWIGNYFYLLYKYSFLITKIGYVFYVSEGIFRTESLCERYAQRCCHHPPTLSTKIQKVQSWKVATFVYFRNKNFFQHGNFQIWCVRKF